VTNLPLIVIVTMILAVGGLCLITGAAVSKRTLIFIGAGIILIGVAVMMVFYPDPGQ
jgi:hypothetical protein